MSSFQISSPPVSATFGANPNRSGKRFYKIETATLGGFAIALGAPVLVALLIFVAPLLGFETERAAAAIRVLAALAEIAAIVAIVTFGEKRLLGSIGIRKPTVIDLQYGLGIATICWMLAILLPSVFSPSTPGVSVSIGTRLSALYPEGLAFNSGKAIFAAFFALPILAVAQELVMRGFVVSRLRTFTGGHIVGGVAAFVLTLVANLPLWGFTYTLEIAPIEAVLIGLFLWKRRLLPCIVANFATGFLLLVLVAFAGAPEGSHKSMSRAPMLPGSSTDQGKAIDQLNRALQSQWGPAAPLVERASEAVKRGEYDKAIAETSKAIAMLPDQPALYVFRGDLYSTQNHHQPAVDDYSKAISMVPSAFRVYLRRANEYVKMDQDVSAHRDFAKAIELEPKNANTYIDRSALYVREKRYEEGLNDVDTALKLEPNDYSSLIRRAEVLELMHRYDDAIATCDHVIGLDSSRAEGYACRAQTKMVKGDLRGAVADYDEVLKRAPDDRGALVNRADLEMRTEQWAAAKADAGALARLNTIDAETADWLAFPLAASVHAELRDGPTAVALATHACEASNFREIKYIETLAAAYAESGDFTQAIKWQQQALQMAQASDASWEPLLRWQLDRYQKGFPYREDDAGAITRTPSRARYVFAIIATVMALIGFVTVVVGGVKLLLRGLRRRSAIA